MEKSIHCGRPLVSVRVKIEKTLCGLHLVSVRAKLEIITICCRPLVRNRAKIGKTPFVVGR